VIVVGVIRTSAAKILTLSSMMPLVCMIGFVEDCWFGAYNLFRMLFIYFCMKSSTSGYRIQFALPLMIIGDLYEFNRLGLHL